MKRQTLAQLAVCSWSGWPETPQVLLERLHGIGLSRVQLALDPLLDKPEWAQTLPLLRAEEITVVSGMFGTAEENYATPATIRETGGLAPEIAYRAILERVPRYVALLDELGLDKVSFHAGFIPHDPADPRRGELLARLGTVADAFAAKEKQLLLETGQETAATLVALLRELDRPNLRVNFDPGNMLLYSMGEPLEALQMLLPWVAQVHIKDAIASGDPEVWGTEMPAGEGQVNWPRFFALLAEAGYAGNLVIERECGSDPVGEIRRAVNFLSTVLG